MLDVMSQSAVQRNLLFVSCVLSYHAGDMEQARKFSHPRECQVQSEPMSTAYSGVSNESIILHSKILQDILLLFFLYSGYARTNYDKHNQNKQTKSEM